MMAVCLRWGLAALVTESIQYTLPTATTLAVDVYQSSFGRCLVLMTLARCFW